MHACHFCAAVIENPREVFRGSECPSCHRDLKICMNCRFYSPGAHWDCTESIEEQVRDKERSNFCSFFVFRVSAPGASGAVGHDSRQQAKRKLDRLFGNGT